MQDERPSKTQRKKEVEALQALGERLVDLNADQLERWDGQSREATAAHHRVERWRLRLLEDDEALTEFAREHPHADLQRLRTCVRETRKERVAGGEPRHFRDLFRLIRDAESATGAEPPL